MGRVALGLLLAALALEMTAAPVSADVAWIGDVPAFADGPIFEGRQTADFDGPYNNSEAVLRQSIQQALSLQRENGMDNWAWRDAVEDRLASLGDRAIPYLQGELERREGFERDALVVALFRLQHRQLVPQEALATWAKKRSATGERAFRFRRILWQPGPAAALGLLPHHLFYVAVGGGGQPAARFVLAVAGDGQVKDVSRDAELARFLQVELEPAVTDAQREAVGDEVALLAAARSIDLYRQDRVESHGSGGALERVMETFLRGDGRSFSAKVTFAANGKVSAVQCGEGAAPVAPIPPSPPIDVPAAPTTVPAMPG